MTSIALQIRDAREAAGLTQKRLAELAGITQPKLCEYEAGRIDPSATRFQKIIEVCQAEKTSDSP